MIENTTTLANNEVIKYRKYGNGKKILILIHGNICSGIFFEPFLKYFDPDKYTIFIPDLRGFGESSYFKKINNISDFVKDLKYFFINLNIEKFSLLGWSAGGAICLNYSLIYPEDVTNLILVNSVGILGYPMLDENGQKYLTIEEISKEKSQVLPVLKALQSKNKSFIRNLWDNVIYIHNKPNAIQADKEATFALMQRNLPEVYLALSNFNISSFTFPHIPTLIIFGENDSIISEEDILLTASYLNTNNIIKLKNTGHSPFIDCPDKLFKEIDSFI